MPLVKVISLEHSPEDFALLMPKVQPEGMVNIGSFGTYPFKNLQMQKERMRKGCKRLAVRYFYDSYTPLSYPAAMQPTGSTSRKMTEFLTRLSLLEAFYMCLEQHNLKFATDILTSFYNYLVDFTRRFQVL